MPSIAEKQAQRYGTAPGRRRTAWGLTIWLLAALLMGLFAVGYGIVQHRMTLRAGTELFLGITVVINAIRSTFERVRQTNELDSLNGNRQLAISIWAALVHQTFAVFLLAALLFDAWTRNFKGN